MEEQKKEEKTDLTDEATKKTEEEVQQMAEEKGIDDTRTVPLDEKTTNKSAIFLIVILVGVVLIFGAIYAVTKFHNPDPVMGTGNIVGIDAENPSEDKTTEYTYNGHDFYKKGDMWHTMIGVDNYIYDIEFYFGPREAQKVQLEGSLNDTIFSNNAAYVTVDPSDKNFTFLALAVGHLDTNLIKSFNKYMMPACTTHDTEEEACFGVPVVNCENTKETPVFLVKEAEEPSVTIDGNCVTIKGEGWELVKAVERFLYKAYNIII